VWYGSPVRERPLLDRLRRGILAPEPDARPPILPEGRLRVARVAAAPLFAGANGLSPPSRDQFARFLLVAIKHHRQTLPRRTSPWLPTRIDRLREDRLFVLDERDEVHILVRLDNDDGVGQSGGRESERRDMSCRSPRSMRDTALWAHKAL